MVCLVVAFGRPVIVVVTATFTVSERRLRSSAMPACVRRSLSARVAPAGTVHVQRPKTTLFALRAARAIPCKGTMPAAATLQE